MRSLIHQANADGIGEIVGQQFELASQISAAGLAPIIEPEVSIKSPDKAKAEELLKEGILEKLNRLAADELVLLKLTLPEKDGFYSELVAHSNVIRYLRFPVVIRGKRRMIGCGATAASSRAFRAHCSTDSPPNNPILNLMPRSTIRSRASSKLQQRKISCSSTRRGTSYETDNTAAWDDWPWPNGCEHGAALTEERTQLRCV
jgi:hypothetical protein